MSRDNTKLLQFRVTDNLHAWFAEAKKRVEGVNNMHDFLLFLAIQGGYEAIDQDFPKGTSLTLIKNAINNGEKH